MSYIVMKSREIKHCTGVEKSLLPSLTWKVKVAQSYPTLCDPMDYTDHGIIQARILEWVAVPLSGDLPNQGLNQGSLHCRWILYQLSCQGSPSLTWRNSRITRSSFHVPCRHKGFWIYGLGKS